jgi:hypothetical protein
MGRKTEDATCGKPVYSLSISCAIITNEILLIEPRNGHGSLLFYNSFIYVNLSTNTTYLLGQTRVFWRKFGKKRIG